MIIELKRVSRYTSWYFALIPLFILFSIIGFNRLSRDYLSYQLAFSNFYVRNTYEFGYVKLVDFVQIMGLDHTSIVFLTGVLLLLVLLQYLKTNNHINLVVFFYCVYPLVFDINQTRNTLMYLIIILSLVYVIKEKPVKHYILLFISFSIHNIAVVYLPFYYLSKWKRKTFIRVIIIATISLFVVSQTALGIAAKYYPEIALYLQNPPRFGPIMLIFYLCLDIFTVWWIQKRISPRLEEKEKRKMEVLYRFVWYPILAIPFAFYVAEFERLQRNGLLVKYVFSALAMRYMSVKEKLITVLLLLLSVASHIGVLIYANELELFDFLKDNIVYYYLDMYLF